MGIYLSLTAQDIRDVATKQDIERLREEFYKFREEVRERISKLEGRFDLFVKLFIAFNVPLLIAVIGILLKMMLVP